MLQGILQRIQGNARVCLQFEPLFMVPYVFIATYATVYMYEVGLDETQIGLITTTGLIVQVLAAFMSGYLTDRMGRKNALMFFDILCWTIPFVILIFASNFWFFLIAAIFNGLVRIAHTAFSCLIVEDTPQRDRSLVFMVLQFMIVVGGLIAPLGGFFVAEYGEIPAIRGMYVVAFICITAMIILRYFKLKETDIGIRKMKETREISMQANWNEYKRVTRKLFKNRSLMMVFIVYSLFTFQMTLMSTYSALYFVNYLQIPSAWISIFPAVTSLTMIAVMLLVVPRIPAKYTNQLMIAGFTISLVGITLLITAPTQSIFALIWTTLILALGKIFTYPYLESAVANEIDDEERANTTANLWVIVLLVTAPSGLIGGWAYHVDPRLPFVLIAIAFVSCASVMVVFHRKTRNRLIVA
jgi:DHA1 family tetracycline resistance protein-like MFS transporter